MTTQIATANSSRELPTHYVVQTAAAAMPQSCWGHYRRVAVLEMEAGFDRASMISGRARGVVRVVRTWEKCSVGKTERCAYSRAVAAAEALAEKLNSEHRRGSAGEEKAS